MSLPELLQHPRRWLAAAPALLLRGWQGARQTARLAIGVPDYPAYLRHCRAHHPGQSPMTYAEFFSERQAARYRGTGGRCC
jgi:uncharacterized short protein YbdD (DUF466 family)